MPGVKSVRCQLSLSQLRRELHLLLSRRIRRRPLHWGKLILKPFDVCLRSRICKDSSLVLFECEKIHSSLFQRLVPKERLVSNVPGIFSSLFGNLSEKCWWCRIWCHPSLLTHEHRYVSIQQTDDLLSCLCSVLTWTSVWAIPVDREQSA